MDWDAFNGITQFLTTIATFIAITITLYEIRKEYATKLDVRIIPNFPEKHGQFYEMYFRIKVINLSQRPVFIENASIYAKHGKDKTRYTVDFKNKIIHPGEAIESLIDGRSLYENNKKKRPAIFGNVTTSDMKVFETKYRYSKNWFILFDDTEKKNYKIEGYAELKQQRKRIEKKARIKALNLYNEGANGSFFDKASKKQLFWFRQKERLHKIGMEFMNYKHLWIVGLVLFGMVILYFAIIGVISLFSTP